MNVFVTFRNEEDPAKMKELDGLQHYTSTFLMLEGR